MKMMLEFGPSKLEIDPTSHYIANGKDIHRAVHDYYILFNWLFAGKEVDVTKRAKDILIDSYAYYMGDMDITTSTFDMDGTYHYPEDPPMYPLVRVKYEDETVYFYPHAFVASIQSDGTTWMSRFD